MGTSLRKMTGVDLAAFKTALCLFEQLPLCISELGQGPCAAGVGVGGRRNGAAVVCVRDAKTDSISCLRLARSVLRFASASERTSLNS